MIDKLRNRFSLPLLARDLTQQAGRRSMYILRTILIIGMIAWVWLATNSVNNLGGRTASSLQSLGSGRWLFQDLVGTLFIGIYILVPILSCGSIAQEKENDSLQLLLLTRLGPWAILLEKYLSRVLPMLLYLFCALPIFAYLYSLGGITEQQIFASFYLLVLAILQLNAICLFCSAASGKTINALVLSLFVMLFFYVAPAFLLSLIETLFSGLLSWRWTNFLNTVSWFTIPPVLNSLADENYLAQYTPLPFAQTPSLQLVLASTPIWISIVIFLVLARVILLRKAINKSRNWLYVFFEKLDGIFNEWNEDMGGGIVLIKERNDLPEYEPIAWKETRKSAIGTARYLFRMLVVLELPILLLCLVLISEGSRNSTIFYFFSILMICIAMLILVNKSTGLITQERMQQTLDVVLTTPVNGRDIILQKSRGVRKLWIIVMIPVLTVIISKMLIITSSAQFAYLTFACAFTLTTTWLGIWLSIFIGLRQKRHIYAVTTTLSILGIWCVSFWLLRLLFVFGLSPDDLQIARLISPLEVLRMIDGLAFNDLNLEFYSNSTILGYLVYTALATCLIRYSCLKQADQLSGRISDSSQDLKPTPPRLSLTKEEKPLHA
ncbi:MAG: ABC transporter permease subunit [Planctomycetaceae bacterium]|nr:ABC transporter permease subunit [Planctomycetaceae bacterium]